VLFGRIEESRNACGENSVERVHEDLQELAPPVMEKGTVDNWTPLPARFGVERGLVESMRGAVCASMTHCTKSVRPSMLTVGDAACSKFHFFLGKVQLIPAGQDILPALSGVVKAVDRIRRGGSDRQLLLFMLLVGC